MVSQPSEAVIDLHDVHKTYRGGVQALRGVDLKVDRGDVFGLLGPNGAGKSTIVKIMMTVVKPTRVSGTMLGQPIGTKATLKRVGYLPEHHRFPPYLTGRQTLMFYAALADVDAATRRKKADELLEIVGMTDWQNKKISQYSKGMMQRIGLAQAMMNDPDLLVLDEPTDGVDPVGRREIRDLLLSWRERGKTIFLNSHLLSELEMVCTRVAIMVQGRMQMTGTIDDLTEHSRRYEVDVDVREDVALPDGLAEVWTSAPTAEGRRFTGSTDSLDAVQELLDCLRGLNHRIVAVRPVRETLEDLFMRAVHDPTTGQAHKPGAAPPTARRHAS